jgi:hypothetical protein
MPVPQIGKLTGTITWSDGSNFNGFAVIGLVFPTSSGAAWPELSLEPNSFRQRIPQWSVIPIVDGAFNSSVGLFYNENIDPPNTKYAIYYYDSSNKVVGSPSAPADFFIISAPTTTPTMYTLTVPIAGTAIPNPEG